MNKILKNKFLPAIVWLVVILIVSGFPGDKVPEVPIWQFDKLVHSVVYAILSITLLLAFQKPKNRLKTFAFIILFGIFYGGIMEILQHYIFINRSGNWYDFIANAIGAILGILMFPFVMKLLPINRWLKL